MTQFWCIFFSKICVVTLIWTGNGINIRKCYTFEAYSFHYCELSWLWIKNKTIKSIDTIDLAIENRLKSNVGVDLILCAHVGCPRTKKCHCIRNEREEEEIKKATVTCHCFCVIVWSGDFSFVACGMRVLLCKYDTIFEKCAIHKRTKCHVSWMKTDWNRVSIAQCMHLFDHSNHEMELPSKRHFQTIANEIFQMICLTYT